MKSTKEVFSIQGPWHSPSTLPTTVHGQAFILFPYYPISSVVEEKKIKKQTTFLTPLGHLFLLCSSHQQQKYKLFRGPFNEHSHQVLFQWASMVPEKKTQN
jgi:hypothetical protein